MRRVDAREGFLSKGLLNSVLIRITRSSKERNGFDLLRKALTSGCGTGTKQLGICFGMRSPAKHSV
jgi:hypothetical protein